MTDGWLIESVTVEIEAPQQLVWDVLGRPLSATA